MREVDISVIKSIRAINASNCLSLSCFGLTSSLDAIGSMTVLGVAADSLTLLKY